jgi:hypothetical protein
VSSQVLKNFMLSVAINTMHSNIMTDSFAYSRLKQNNQRDA